MQPHLSIPALVAALTLASISDAAAGGDLVAGPVEARVLRVIDGDTLEAEARIWPGHLVRVAIRIRGIDAPELRGGCAAEKAAARLARSALADLLAGADVRLRNVGADKYFGRVVADVTTAGGDDLAGRLIGLAMARPYDGAARTPFCER